MAPVAQSDIDMESRTSGQDSPLRRQFSEPLHAPSTSTQAFHSPAPTTHQAKCPSCGEYFESSEEDPFLHDENLKEHIATVHPHLAKISTHDDAADDEEVENGQVGDGDHDDEDVDEQQENGEDEDGDDAIEAEDGTAEGLKASEEANISEDEEEEDQGPALDDNTDHDADFPVEDNPPGRREFLSAEKRLYTRWNIHDPRNFAREYDDTIAELDQDWDYAFREAKSSKKRDVSEPPERPDPYKKTRADRGKFLELTPIEDFLVDLRDPEMHSPEELYAITANAAHALATWQDEYFAVDQLYKLSTGQYEKLTVDPRKKVEEPNVAADKQEATLYHYRYDAGKHKKNQEQDPWIQGGFRPTPTQVRKALKTTKVEPGITPNVDGWATLQKFGDEYVPKYQDPPPEDAPSKATRTRKAAEMEAAAAADEAARAAEEEELPAKRQTRSSRFVQDGADGEEPSSPKAMRGGRGRGQARGQGRGRGRGRGAASTPSGGAHETPISPVSTPSSTRGRGRGSGIGRGNARGGARGRGKGRAPSSTPIATPKQMSPAPPTTAPPSRPTSVAPTPSQLTPIEPMPNGGFSTIAPSANPNPPEMDFEEPEKLDPAEQERRDKARAEKIANSKNPRRTEAMLNHWARFNRAGRIRNPKRSKDEIEASRVEVASKKATNPPKVSGRKRKSPSLPGGTTMIHPGIAPAPGPLPAPTAAQLPAPAPTQLHPAPGSGPSLPLPTHTSLHPPPGPPLGPGGPLAPHPPQHRYTTPYPPHFGAIDPRGIAPYPSGPFQPPPPQPAYQTPYPEYFIPFGTGPGHGLPPPGHARRPA